jgi:N-acetylglucosamine kinase-like BadF-type ATPase
MPPDPIRYILGIDGGSSKTHAMLVDGCGHYLGFGQGGSANHQTRGLKSALREIQRAVRSALKEAHLSQDAVELGCFCLAGADLPDDYAMLQEAVESLSLARSVIIKNDTMAALRAGLSRPWGVVIICGAGFNAAGRAPDGREIVFPGLGAISGDWGGGGELSLEMIRRVVRAWDGRGKETLLTHLVLDELKVPTVEALIAGLYRGEIREQSVLALVPILFEAALAGDEVASDMIIQLGKEVGLTAGVLAKRLGMDQEDVEVVLGGSVFKGRGPLLLETITQTVHEYAPRARVKRTDHEPVVGAALLALEAIGAPLTESLYGSLKSTMPSWLSYNQAGV